MSESSAAKSSDSSSLGLRRDAKNLDPCRTARMSEDVVVLATELLVEEDDVLGAVVLTTEDVVLETEAAALVTDVDLTVVVLGMVVANVVFLNGVAALDVVMLMMTGEESGSTASCPAVESLTELMVESSKSSLKVVTSNKASAPRMPCWPVAVTVTVVVMVVVS